MILTVVISLLLLNALIFAHEFGHYLAARTANIHVIEFAIGFGKKILSWERSGTTYSLRLLPIGGFCQLSGESPGDMSFPGQNFQEKSVLQRLIVIFAGPFLNIIIGIALLFLTFFLFIGIPQTNSTVIGNITNGSIAYENGLQEGDKILSINNQEVKSWEEIVTIISSSSDEILKFDVLRKGKTITINILNNGDLLGISSVVKRYQLIPSIVIGIKQSLLIFHLIILSFGEFVTGNGLENIAGPVGIISIIGDSFQSPNAFYFLTAVISLNLGIINLLPFPALDGSRIVFLLIEAIIGRPVDSKKEALIHNAGLLLLISLMVLITFQDIARLLS